MPRRHPLYFRCRRVSTFVGVMLLIGVIAFHHEFSLSAAEQKEESPASTASDDDQLRDEVLQLIKELQADRRVTRVAAEQSLKKLGPAVLPFFPPPDSISNPAARESVRRIRLLLERELALASAQAGTVTLNGEMPLKGILDEFSQQTGNVLDAAELDSNVAQQTFAVQFDETPFWQAWDDIRKRASLRESHMTHDSALPIHSKAENEVDELPNLAVDYAGPFRLMVTSLRRIDQVGKVDQQRLRVNVNLATEPRLRPLFLKYAADDVLLSTPDGEPLPTATPGAKWDLSWGTNDNCMDLRWDFLVPREQPLEKLACQGTLNVEMAAGSQRFTFDRLDASERVAQRHGGVIVELDRVAVKTTAEGTDLAIRIAVQYDVGGPAFESHRNWMFHNRAALVARHDAEKGERTDAQRQAERVRPNDLQTERQGDGTFVLTYRFDNLKQVAHDYQFEYQAPTLILTIPVTFSFPMIEVPKPATPEK